MKRLKDVDVKLLGLSLKSVTCKLLELYSVGLLCSIEYYKRNKWFQFY